MADSPSGISGPQFSFVPGQEIGTIHIGGITQLGPNFALPQARRQNIFTWSDDLFYTKGAHSLIQHLDLDRLIEKKQIEITQLQKQVNEDDQTRPGSTQ